MAEAEEDINRQVMHEHWSVRVAVAQRMDLTPEQVDSLSKDEHELVRLAVARHNRGE